jgi:hypothetical protein
VKDLGFQTGGGMAEVSHRSALAGEPYLRSILLVETSNTAVSELSMQLAAPFVTMK